MQITNIEIKNLVEGFVGKLDKDMRKDFVQIVDNIKDGNNTKMRILLETLKINTEPKNSIKLGIDVLDTLFGDSFNSGKLTGLMSKYTVSCNIYMANMIRLIACNNDFSQVTKPTIVIFTDGSDEDIKTIMYSLHMVGIDKPFSTLLNGVEIIMFTATEASTMDDKICGLNVLGHTIVTAFVTNHGQETLSFRFLHGLKQIADKHKISVIQDIQIESGIEDVYTSNELLNARDICDNIHHIMFKKDINTNNYIDIKPIKRRGKYIGQLYKCGLVEDSIIITNCQEVEEI